MFLTQALTVLSRPNVYSLGLDFLARCVSIDLLTHQAVSSFRIRQWYHTVPDSKQLKRGYYNHNWHTLNIVARNNTRRYYICY